MPLFDNIVNQSQYQQPIPLEYLYKGLATQQAYSEKNLQELQGDTQSIFNIKPVSEADAQVLQKAQDAMQKSLQGISVGDLNDPRNVSQLHTLISSVTNNPDVMAVAQRSASVAKMKSEKDKAESAGKEYFNPGWDEYIKYANSGQFIRNKQFTSDGKVVPDMSKLFHEAEQNVPEQERYNPETGTYEKYKNMDDVKSALNFAIKTTPNALAYLKYQFSQSSQDVDWENGAVNKASEDYNKALDNYNSAVTRVEYLKHNGGSQNQILAAMQDVKSHANDMDEYHSLATNGYLPHVIRQQYENDFINSQINNYAKAATYIKDEGKMGEKQRIELEKSYDLQRERETQDREDYRKQLELAAQEGVLKQDEKGNLILAKPGEEGTLPATKSSVLHVGGNPLAGDVKLEEIDKSIADKNAAYPLELVNNSKLKNPKAYNEDYNNAEITPEGNIALWTVLGGNKVKPEDKTVFTPEQFSSMIVGKDSKSQTLVGEYFKKKNLSTSKVGDGIIYQGISPTTKVIKTPLGGTFNIQRNVKIPSSGTVLPAVPIVSKDKLDKVDPGHYYISEEDNHLKIKR